MFFDKKDKVEKTNYPKDRFLISTSEDGNDYFVIVWDMWLKSLKEPYGRRKLMSFKNNTPAKEINGKVNMFIEETKGILRKEFKEELLKETKNAKR